MGAFPGREAGIELAAIYEISKILSSSLDLNKTARGVLGVLAAHLKMKRGMVCLVLESGELQVVEATGMSAEAVQRGRFRRGEGITGKVLETGVPIVVPDVSAEPLFLNRTRARSMAEGRGVAFLAVPIKVGRDTVGVLSIDRELDGEPVSFETDVRFLAMVANLIGQTTRLHENVAAEREELMQYQHRLQKELHGKYSLDNVIGRGSA
jgi:Nif-specific regulatory protein